METPSLIGRDEAAQLLGIAPASVRTVLGRAGISAVRGWPRAPVETLARNGQRKRDDLATSEALERLQLRLRPSERATLARVLAAHPAPITRADLAADHGSAGALRACLSVLARAGLVALHGPMVSRGPAMTSGPTGQR